MAKVMVMVVVVVMVIAMVMVMVMYIYNLHQLSLVNDNCCPAPVDHLRFI